MSYRFTRTVLFSLTMTLATCSAASVPCQAHLVAMPDVGVAAASATVNPVKAAERALKEMGESIHRAKVAAVDLVRECSREDTVMEGGEIDFIGTDVIPILPDTADGLGSDQYLPPRKSYLDLHMTRLGMVLPILKQDIASTRSPDPAQKAIIDKSDVDMQSFLDDAMTHYQNLKSLTAGTSAFDRQAIIAEAKGVHKDVVEIDKIRKKVYGDIKHDPNDKSIEKKAEQQTAPPASK